MGTEEVLKSVSGAIERVTGGEFFRALTKSMASALDVPFAVAATYPDSPPTRVRTLAIWTPQGFSDDLDYDLVGSPCALVVAGETCVYRDGASALFPNAKPIQLLGAESYIGIPLTGPSGNVNGHLAVLDTKPMADTEKKVAALEVFAGRAGAELHRMRAEAALRAAVEGTASTSGAEFFPKLVRILADSLQAKFAFVSEVADAKAERLRLLSFWAGTDYGETFEYATKDTPCESVFSQGLRMYPARVQELFSTVPVISTRPLVDLGEYKIIDATDKNRIRRLVDERFVFVLTLTQRLLSPLPLQFGRCAGGKDFQR